MAVNLLLFVLRGFGLFFAGWFALWVLFLAVMDLRAARDAGVMKPGSPAYRIGMLVLVTGYLVDWAMNMTAATLLFLEIPGSPRELVTGRCERHLRDDGFRGSIARWLCRNLLDPFQLGGHCH